MPRAKKNARAPRKPRIDKGPTLDHSFNDTIRVLTDKGAVEYTESTYQVSVGNMLIVYGRRQGGQPYIAALYNSNSWGGVLTIPREIPTEAPTPTLQDA